jgi:hypothetical protein
MEVRARTASELVVIPCIAARQYVTMLPGRETAVPVPFLATSMRFIRGTSHPDRAQTGQPRVPGISRGWNTATTARISSDHSSRLPRARSQPTARPRTTPY